MKLIFSAYNQGLYVISESASLHGVTRTVGRLLDMGKDLTTYSKEWEGIPIQHHIGRLEAGQVLGQ